MLVGEHGSILHHRVKISWNSFPANSVLSDAEAKEIDQLVKQSLKEVNEELLKIMHSIKHETMNEITTGSSRVIRRDKNALITLKAPL